MGWMKFRIVYFLISAIVISVGLFNLLKSGARAGIDFVGGSLIEYKFQNPQNEETLKSLLEAQQVKVSQISSSGENSFLIRTRNLDEAEKDKIRVGLAEAVSDLPLEIRFETVGPTFGRELVIKTVFAILIAGVGILLWIAIQFKSFKFGFSAILAVIHDSLVLLGVYSILGNIYGFEMDFLFVTALLTTLSFSVHDTIVVYDRIREIRKRTPATFSQVADRAVSETLVRSVNNSLTILFMLIALILLGGSTIRHFAAALAIGTISGTYSSPFVAVPILLTWDELLRKLKPHSTPGVE